MKRLLTLGLPILAIAAAVWYWQATTSADSAPPTISALERTGDECDLIAEKAAMHLPEVLPFQKIEKVARRSRVLAMCMQDRAYTENPAWVAFAKPIAQKNAQAEKISYDEAYETFRRLSMLKFKSTSSEPLYWMLRGK